MWNLLTTHTGNCFMVCYLVSLLGYVSPQTMCIICGVTAELLLYMGKMLLLPYRVVIIPPLLSSILS